LNSETPSDFRGAFFLKIHTFIRMENQANTLQVIRLLTATKDSSVLNHIKAVLTTQQDWWDGVPEEIKEEMNQADEELRNGKGSSQATVIKRYKKWL
jgi:hypothetical protein